jgi:hypothetical protein
VILLVAAGLKAHQLATDPFVTLAPRPSSLAPLPSSLAPLLHSRPFLIGIVEFELLLGLLLLSGILPRLTYASSVLCFGGFALVSLYKAISGYASCGCFGRVPVNPWYTFALDAAAVVALLRWRPRGPSRIHVPAFARSAAVLAVWLLVGTPVALATWSRPAATLTDLGEVLAGGRIVILKPETWVGKQFPLLDYVDIGDRLRRGKWIVLVYHHDCPRCREAMAESRKAVGSAVFGSDRSQVAWIEMPPYADVPDGDLAAEGRLVFGRLNVAKEWFASTPVEIVLSDGAVRRVKSG